jgi:hypothetical protein
VARIRKLTRPVQFAGQYFDPHIDTSAELYEGPIPRLHLLSKPWDLLFESSDNLDLGSTRVLLEGDAEAGGRQLPSMTPKPKSVEGSLVTNSGLRG